MFSNLNAIALGCIKAIVNGVHMQAVHFTLLPYCLIKTVYWIIVPFHWAGWGGRGGAVMKVLMGGCRALPAPPRSGWPTLLRQGEVKLPHPHPPTTQEGAPGKVCEWLWQQNVNKDHFTHKANNIKAFHSDAMRLSYQRTSQPVTQRDRSFPPLHPLPWLSLMAASTFSYSVTSSHSTLTFSYACFVVSTLKIICWLVPIISEGKWGK